MKITTPLTLVALIALSSVADAQSNCYKGECGSLDTRATGSNYGPLDAAFPIQVTGTSGGGVAIENLRNTSSGPCVGNATVLPDHQLHLDHDSTLQLAVEAFRDTTLLVHGPGGWRCNDDSDQLNPGLTDYFEAGTYRIWIGSYDDGYHDYRLTIEERRERPNHHRDRLASLDATSTDAVHESVIYDAGDGIVRMQGRAGGSANARELGETGCVGYTHADPDHIVTLTDRLDLEFSVQSNLDTTLVMHGPHGWRCNDDAYDVYPAIDGSFPPGTYRVWVGTYDSLDSDDYLLTIAGEEAILEIEPVPQISSYSFSGRFESVDVLFTGHDVDEIHSECMRFMATADADMVDDIVVNGRSWRNGPSYWSEENLCSIVALNAVPDLPTDSVVSGSVEGMVPFDVRCGDAERIVSRYLPSATTDLWIDDIEVNGNAMHNGPGYWSGTQAADIVLSHLSDPLARYNASGTIENTPFSFSADSPAEIQSSCAAFINSAMHGQWIDDVVVNGQTRRNNSGWWNVSEVCMIIGSLAEEQY